MGLTWEDRQLGRWGVDLHLFNVVLVFDGDVEARFFALLALGIGAEVFVALADGGRFRMVVVSFQRFGIFLREAEPHHCLEELVRHS